jgi:mannose-6-phosphate isomerase
LAALVEDVPVTLYPLRFAPILKTMLWGGTQLRPLFQLPGSPEPTGEAWVLSDVDGSASSIVNGPLAGQTLRQVLAEHPHRILGSARLSNGRFPVLLKFIDARQELSVQVHPTDEQAQARKPGQAGKTEAWYVVQANPATSRIYAGFRPGVTAADFRLAMAAKTTPDTLHQFVPQVDDCIFLRAGTVHAIGRDTVLFEVQQTSDITYRLYDWDRVDAKTGQPRELHIDDGLACSNFAMGPCHPVTPIPQGDREQLVACEYFRLHRRRLTAPTTIGSVGTCRMLVCIAGSATLGDEPLTMGSVVLIPAELGTATVHPAPTATLLEISLADAPHNER